MTDFPISVAVTNAGGASALATTSYTVTDTVPAAHRYWRLLIGDCTETNPYNGRYVEFANVEFLVNGVDQTSPAGSATAATASSFYQSVEWGNFPPPLAFDDDPSTPWACSNTPSWPEWLAYDFGAPVAIDAFSITVANQPGRSPKDWQIQFRDEGGAWTSTGSYTSEMADWTAGVKRTFPVGTPLSAGGAYHVSDAGNDSNDGMSEATPWKTIGRANAHWWEPGNRLRFRAGDKFDGNVWFHPGNFASLGDQANRIIVETYFPVIGGPLAEINPTVGGATGIVHVDRVSGVTVQGLKLTAPDLTKMPRGGVLITNNSAQRIGGITVQNNDISGIRYAEAHGDFGGQVFIEGWPGTGGIENVVIQGNLLHGRDGVTSRDDLGIGMFGGGLNLFNIVQRGNLCYHIGAAGGLAWPPMGDGLNFNGVNGGLAEFNIVHDNAWNFTRGGGGPCAFLTANTDGALFQFNEGYNIQPASMIWAVDFVGLDFDNDTKNSVGQFNYFHDNYNAGIMHFANSAGGQGWNNNTLRKNLCVNNCKAGFLAFGEITVCVKTDNPTLHVTDNVTYNDRVYHGQQHQAQDQGAVGISITDIGTLQGTISGNRQVISKDAHGFWQPIYANKGEGSAWTPTVVISGNEWVLRGDWASFSVFWGSTIYQNWSQDNDVTMRQWETASGKGPNITIAYGSPEIFTTYALALTAAERTIATDALAAITWLPGIDIVGSRAAALSIRLLAGDSPVTLPEFIALGFALVRADTAAGNALLSRTKAIVLAG